MPNFLAVVNHFRLSSALQGKYAEGSNAGVWEPKMAIYDLLIQEVHRGYNQYVSFSILQEIRIYPQRKHTVG